MFLQANLVNQNPAPAGIYIYRRSFLYTTPDAISDVIAVNYFIGVTEAKIQDYINVESSHPTDGGKASLRLNDATTAGYFPSHPPA